MNAERDHSPARRPVAGRGPVKAVLFDMDNTLFDLVGAKRRACRVVTRLIGKEDGSALFNYFLRPVYDFESHSHIRDYLCDQGICPEDPFPTLAGEEPSDTLSVICRAFEEEKLAGIAPYPGVRETLFTLCARGVPMVLVTDAWREQALARLGRSGLGCYFQALITVDVTGRRKPAHDPFLAALAELGTRPGETLFVGDSLRRDIAPAKELGIITVYAAYGDRNSTPPLTVAPDYIITDIRDILPLVPATSPPG